MAEKTSLQGFRRKYLSMTLGLATVCGVMFELPLVVLVLHRLV